MRARVCVCTCVNVCLLGGLVLSVWVRAHVCLCVGVRAFFLYLHVYARFVCVSVRVCLCVLENTCTCSMVGAPETPSWHCLTRTPARVVLQLYTLVAHVEVDTFKELLTKNVVEATA